MNANTAVRELTAETVVAVLPREVPGEVPAAVEPKETQLESEVFDIELRAEAVVIRCDDDFTVAGEFGRLLKQKAADVVAFFKPMKDSAYKAHKAVCDREKTMLSPLQRAEKTLKKTMGAYSLEQERKRREQEEALRRAAEEESRRKLEEAEKLEDDGDTDGAEAALVDATVMEDAGRCVFVPNAIPKATGVSTSKDWEIVGIDSAMVPLVINGAELRPVDTAAVMRLIRASKGKISIPGITYRETAKMSFRRA